MAANTSVYTLVWIWAGVVKPAEGAGTTVLVVLLVVLLHVFLLLAVVVAFGTRNGPAVGDTTKVN